MKKRRHAPRKKLPVLRQTARFALHAREKNSFERLRRRLRQLIAKLFGKK